MYPLLVLIFCGLAACKKEKDPPANGGNPTDPPASTINYELSISATQGYLAANPLKITGSNPDAGDIFAASYGAQSTHTLVRVRASKGSDVADFQLYFNGGKGTGTKMVEPSPNFLESDIFIMKSDGSFSIKVIFPQQTPVQISAYGAPGNALTGKISGMFKHREIISSPYTVTEYDAETELSFTVKRNE